MLRVNVQHGPTEVRLHLEGRLAGPWVWEVERCWRSAQPAIGGRAVTVDLRGIDFVDSAGEALLAIMHRDGARLLATSPMMAHLIREIVGAPE